MAPLFYLFLASAPFGTRVLLHQFTRWFHEYEAVFLYASDIFLVLFLASTIFYFLKHKSKILSFKTCQNHHNKGSRPLWFIEFKNLNLFRVSIFAFSLFIITAGISIFSAYSHGLAAYNFARLLLLAAMAVAVAKMIHKGILRLKTILAVIAALAVLQSLIGIGQFIAQSDLGLSFLGESALGPNINGVSKIEIKSNSSPANNFLTSGQRRETAKILRAYGTFPHPNILAAFLLIGLFSVLELFFKNPECEMQNLKRFWSFEFKTSNLFRIFTFVFCIFVLILGLLFTFSRAAWLIAALLLPFTVLYYLISFQYRRKAIFITIIMLFLFLLLFLFFKPYILSRMRISADEPAVAHRIIYHNIGFYLVKQNPILGVGIGNQVLYSFTKGIYQMFGMDQSWQWQPIHNIYLLVFSEIGIIGGLSFIAFIAALLISNFKFSSFFLLRRWNFNENHKLNYETLAPTIILSALLLFGFVDHFLWTLQQGRLMLWMMIGIVMASLLKFKLWPTKMKN